MIDSPHRLLTFGWDFKITPDDQFALIEGNGMQSGYEGALRFSPHLKNLRQLLHLELVRWLRNYGSIEGFFDEENDDLKITRGQKIESKISKKETRKARKFLGRNSRPLESVLRDKFILKFFIPEEHNVPFILSNGGNIDEVQGFIEQLFQKPHPLINMERYPLIIAKPRRDIAEHDPIKLATHGHIARSAAHGHGVRCFFLKHERASYKLLQYLKAPQQDPLIVEPFVPSRLFPHPETHAGHDACIRLVQDFYFDKVSGKIHQIFWADYVRLSPVPWDEEHFSEDMCKANLTGENPAIPIPGNEAILETMQFIGAKIVSELMGTLNQKKEIDGHALL